MNNVKEQYVVNERGDRVGVLVGWKYYRHLLEEIEELEAIRAYDVAKSRNGKPVPFKQAIDEIKRKRH